jgi:hypothetical protein
MSLLADDVRYWREFFVPEPFPRTLWYVYSEILFFEVMRPIWRRVCISPPVFNAHSEVDCLLPLLATPSSSSRKNWNILLKERYMCFINEHSCSDIDVFLDDIYTDIHGIYTLYDPF